MTALRQTRQVSLRYLRQLYRQGAWIGITLTQPLIWLVLFGALFKSVTDIPGFEGCCSSRRCWRRRSRRCRTRSRFSRGSGRRSSGP